MNVQAKELLIILIGVIISLIITIFFQDNEEISIENIFILLIVAIAFIIYVVYKRIGELDEEIISTKEQYKKLQERLKIHQQLTNIEARLIVLENKNGKKKN